MHAPSVLQNAMARNMMVAGHVSMDISMHACFHACMNYPLDRGGILLGRTNMMHIVSKIHLKIYVVCDTFTLFSRGSSIISHLRYIMLVLTLFNVSPHSTGRQSYVPS